MHKSRSEYRDGYKAHIAIEPETGLVTEAILTPANVVGRATALALLAGEEPGLEVLGDSGLWIGRDAGGLAAAEHATAIKPWPLQTAVPGGFDRDDFVIDHEAGTATCPAGHTVTITAHLNAVFTAHCGGCTLASRCTTAQGAERSTSLLTTKSSSRPRAVAQMVSSQRTTDDCARWSSARSPGWSPTPPTGALPGRGEEPARSLACGSQQSTYDA